MPKKQKIAAEEKVRIPKEYLLNFLCSEFYMRYKHKPRKQKIDMCQIHNVDLESPCAGCKHKGGEKHA